MDILAERREEIVDDAAAAGFDLGGDRHAGGDRLLAPIASTSTGGLSGTIVISSSAGVTTPPKL